MQTALLTNGWMAVLALGMIACGAKEEPADAYGNFEAVETIVSAEATGVLQRFELAEGQTLPAGQVIGLIDTTQLQLRKAQLAASQEAVRSRLPNLNGQLGYFEQQLALQEQQLRTLQREKERTQNLVAAGAAPSKQLDDLVAQIESAQRQIALIRGQKTSQTSVLTTQRSGTQAETAPLQEQIRLLDEQIRKSTVVNPLKGTVTVKLAEPAELVTYGKPLYKIADLSRLVLRAYVSGNQLVDVKVGQRVSVRVDAPNDQYRTYEGTVQWLSDKAEFTPKIIQTKEERVNLVYAMKVLVPNDGALKMGMPGEVRFNSSPSTAP
jgi:HlyD family secretion protein